MQLPQKIGYYLEPGYIYFSRRAAAVRAVLGSCVAICIWDRALKFGGMNHFIWPSMQDPDNATPKYGNVATTALLRMMQEAGCRRHDLVAHLLGGAAQEDCPTDDLGGRNAAVAREVLAKKGVKVLSEDVGGHVGRKVVFDTGSGELAVLKVQQIRDSDWHEPKPA
ncbi:MAG: chemotaxis protein CheD [bacterium]|nr:chemotaxis protein CheD [bacterium]